MSTPMRVLIAALSFCGFLVACATTDQPGATDGPVAAAPTLAVGTRWVYRGREGFRMPVAWEETHEITSIGANGISVHVTLKGPGVDYQRDELLSAPGVVRVGALMDVETRRFATPLLRYRYPLAPGATWNQWVDNFNERLNREGQINRYVRVGGWEKVSTPAGEFDAIRMRVLMRLDEVFPWNHAKYRHMEGNSASHLKAIMTGTSQTVLIEDGQLVLGRWQGIYFCEFDGPRHRTCLVKLLEG